MTMSRYVPENLRYVCASPPTRTSSRHSPAGLAGTDCQLVISSIWSRLCRTSAPAPRRKAASWRSGMKAPSAARQSSLRLIPAHFLHSRQLPVLRPGREILFSGRPGASLIPPKICGQAVPILPAIPNMEASTRRYMVSNKVCRLWARMVRQLDIG